MWRMFFIQVVFAVYCIQYMGTEDIEYINLVELLNNTKAVPNLKKILEPKQNTDENVIYADPCADKPCKNNGKCAVKGQGFECSCLEPFFGKICEKDPCSDNPCNDGKCKLNNRGFECICGEDSVGKFCEKSICTDTCKNNGSCTIILKNGRYTVKCRCKPPFMGERCEIEACAKNLCKNDGNCTVINKNFDCSCPEPFSGKFCEVCCVNGQCSHYPEIKCHCYPGYGRLSAGVCKECDCGENIGCSFDGSRKICDCPSGYEQVDGVCKDMCGCGAGQDGCRFSEDGKKECLCRDHLADKNGTCMECDCGRWSESTGCTFSASGAKECHCQYQYSYVKGTCVACNCGERYESIGCTFSVDDTKKCLCRNGFTDVDGNCVEIKTTQKTTPEPTTEKFTEMSPLTSETASEYSSTVTGSDICSAEICGHGYCVVEGSQYSCRCDPGYKGFNCDEKEQSSGPDSMKVALIAVSVTIIPLMIFSGYMAYRYRSSHQEVYT